MPELTPLAASLLLVLADEWRRLDPGMPIGLARLARLCEVSQADCWTAVGELAQKGLVRAYDRSALPGQTKAAAITSEGQQVANSLGIVPHTGPVAEFAKGLDDVGLAILDAVTEGQLQIAGGAPTRSHVRTSVRKAIKPKPDIEATSQAIDALVGTHLEVLGGREPSYQVRLRGLLASQWGKDALSIIEKTFDLLGRLKEKDPSLFRYSWSTVRKACDLSPRALNLTYISLTGAKLGHGWFVSEDDRRRILMPCSTPGQHSTTCTVSSGRRPFSRRRPLPRRQRR